MVACVSASALPTHTRTIFVTARYVERPRAAASQSVWELIIRRSRLKARSTSPFYSADVLDEKTKKTERSPAQRSFCGVCGTALWAWDPRWPELSTAAYRLSSEPWWLYSAGPVPTTDNGGPAAPPHADLLEPACGRPRKPWGVLSCWWCCRRASNGTERDAHALCGMYK